MCCYRSTTERLEQRISSSTFQSLVLFVLYFSPFYPFLSSSSFVTQSVTDYFFLLLLSSCFSCCCCCFSFSFLIFPLLTVNFEWIFSPTEKFGRLDSRGPTFGRSRWPIQRIKWLTCHLSIARRSVHHTQFYL